MRYEDWDVLVFPGSGDVRVPVKEFRVTCHAIADPEFSHTHGAYGFPLMTCFVPSLPPGTPFHISIHTWAAPKVSQFTRAFTKHADLINFEARILIDGRLVATALLDKNGEWPNLINSTSEFTKSGELEKLQFPAFHPELLCQSLWRPGDDIGRIKIIISEGFPRDSMSNPIERIKNVVAFSFQHAPMDRLEDTSIAWPNPSMWRRVPCPPPMFPVPSFHVENGAVSHSHSPRRQNPGLLPQGIQTTGMPWTSGFPGSQIQGTLSSDHATSSAFTQQDMRSFFDPFSASSASQGLRFDTTNPFPQSSVQCQSMMRTSARHPRTDTSMEDFDTTFGTDPMHVSGSSLDDDLPVQAPKVPTNTPTAAAGKNGGQSSGDIQLNSSLAYDFVSTLNDSLLNQPHAAMLLPHQIPLPASEVKSRKENRHLNAGVSSSSPATGSPAPGLADQTDRRTFSRPPFGLNLSLSSSRTGSASPAVSFSKTISRANSGVDFGAQLGETTGNAVKETIDPSIIGIDSTAARKRNFTPLAGKGFAEGDANAEASPHNAADDEFSTKMFIGD